MSAETGDDEVRRFACTSCGKCCDLGPEMELGEAAALADVFVLSLLFKVHSIPLEERSDRATRWWQSENSRIPLRAALPEKRRHLAMFASRRRADRQNDRELYLTMSAAVDDYGGGQCPALSHGLCSVYDRRPVTCRTVPLHYSRQPSALRGYLDRFTAMPGHECDTTGAPAILAGNAILSSDIRAQRERAVALAKADGPWKKHMLSLMDDPETAALSGLPTCDAILTNTDNGYATLLPMIVAWRVAEHQGLLSATELMTLCEKQLQLIKAEIARLPSAHELLQLVPLYEAGAAGRGRLNHDKDISRPFLV